MYNQILRILFLALSLFVFFTSNSTEKYKIGFSQCTTGDIWRETMLREMQIELAFYPKLELIVKDARDNNRKQINDIEEFLKQDIDLLIVSPNESEPLTPVVEKVYNAGIPVIIVDRKITSDSFTAYVGGDNYEIGREAGEYAAKLLKGKGRILEITGLPGSSPTIERHRGFIESISKYPELEIIASRSGKWNWSNGKEVMENMLIENASFDLVFAHNDFMARGAFTAATEQNAEKKFYFLGIDGLPGGEGGIQYVINGDLDATFLYPTGGGDAIDLAYRILNNMPYEKENELPTVVIDSTNAQTLKLQMEQVLSLQDKIESQKSILDLQISKYQSQQLLLIITLILLGAIILLVVVIFRAFRNKKHANEKLAHQKQEIEKRNAEIIKQRDELIRMTEKVEEVTQTKLRFFTNISHEFRTPLTLIIGPLKNLLHSDQYSEETKKQFELMHRNTLRLLRMINQLMDFRKLENEKMSLQAGSYDIVKFLKGIHESFEALANEKKIHFSLNHSDQEINVWFDWDKMDKVIFNLLANAFKFTPNGGSITISVKMVKPVIKTTHDKEVLIEIKDNGKGISPKHLQQIFDRFYQVEKSQGFSGTGLGLTLSKGFIELHHGRIDVKSEVNKGTTFMLYLPTGNQHLSKDEMIEIEQSNASKLHEEITQNEIHYNPEYSDIPSQTDEVLGKNEKPHILIVEDQADVREYVKQSLGNTYITSEAENGIKALQWIEEEEPDLIISDIMMPKMDGLEMMRKLKSDLKTCHIPIILLTAKASQEQKLEGLEEGADSYIPKPFNSRHLQIRVKKLLELRRKIRERYQNQISFESIEDEHQISGMDRKFLDKISRIVEERVNKEELTVEELSKQIGLSRVHLYRKIKHLTGMSVSEFIRLVKLKMALPLLKNSGKSISEIAFEVGFSSPSYFTKSFKEQFGFSPTEYQKK